MARKAFSIIFAFLLSACAIPQIGNAPTSNPIVQIQNLILNDAQASLDLANSQSDKIASICYQGIVDHIKSSGITSINPPDSHPHLIWDFQTVRGFNHTIGNGIPDDLLIACSPLAESAKLDILKLMIGFSGPIKMVP